MHLVQPLLFAEKLVGPVLPLKLVLDLLLLFRLWSFVAHGSRGLNPPPLFAGWHWRPFACR